MRREDACGRARRTRVRRDDRLRGRRRPRPLPIDSEEIHERRTQCSRDSRDFVWKGNVIDLAAAVIIGAAFGAIIDSLVKDVITPIIGMLGGQPDFSAIKVGAIQLGNFLNAVIAFLIKAAALYFLIVLPFSKFGRQAGRLRPGPGPPPQELYLKEIRDLLAQQKR